MVAQWSGGLACWQVDGLSICGQSVACESVAGEVGGLLPWLAGPWLPWFAGPVSCKTKAGKLALGLKRSLFAGKVLVA